MRNYVLWTDCDVNQDRRMHGLEAFGRPEIRKAYHRMWQISRASAKKFLKGDWIEITETSPIATATELLKRNWPRIRDLWHQEPCNILYLDSDCMFVAETEIFDKFKEFRLFNWTAPKDFDTQGRLIFNAGFRYYPHTMDKQLWDIGERLAQDWNLARWDQEQIIFNEMFYRQDLADRHHPELAWQAHDMHHTYKDCTAAHEDWNKCSWQQVKAIHAHGSRNPVDTVKYMERLCETFGILI